MAISKVSDLNSLFNLIYEDAVFVAREQNLLVNLVRNFSARGWMARKLSIYPEVTAELVGEGEDYANPTTFDKTVLATLTPGEVMAQVVLTDRRIETDPDDARRDASTELGNAVSTKIDKDIAATFSDITSGVGAAGASLTFNKVAAALAQLRNAATPNPIYVVLHPFGWFDIWDGAVRPRWRRLQRLNLSEIGGSPETGHRERTHPMVGRVETEREALRQEMMRQSELRV